MTNLSKKSYNSLVSDISAVYESTKKTVVRAYWEIGRRIVEYEQQGADRAEYGARLLESLSVDLTKRCGSGFSRSNLSRMRKFYGVHKKCAPAHKLEWSQHVALLSITDNQSRRHFEKRAVDEGLTRRALRSEVKKVQKKTKAVVSRPAKKVMLAVTRNPVQVFKKLTIAEAPRPKGHWVIDCGFNVWRTVAPAEACAVTIGKPSFTYPATVLSIIDGDTIWARIDCGCGTQVTEKLRFRGIDTPELPTPEGREAKRFVARALKDSPTIVVYTHTSDKYDRYLADIFYLPDITDPTRISTEGHYLNQELLDAGLARTW